MKSSGPALASLAQTFEQAGRLSLVKFILLDWQLLSQAFLHIFIGVITPINMNDDSFIRDCGT